MEYRVPYQNIDKLRGISIKHKRPPTISLKEVDRLLSSIYWIWSLIKMLLILMFYIQVTGGKMLLIIIEV